MESKGPRVTIKRMPPAERPRERLVRHGPGALSNVELLSILLRTGDASSGRSVIDLARELLTLGRSLGPGDDDLDGLRYLGSATVEELSQVKGVGPTKALQVKAAAELGRRISRVQGTRAEVRSPVAAVTLLAGEMRHLEQEHFKVVLLDAKNRVISTELISVGGLAQSSAHPREVFKSAIRKNAAAVILVHNHPSGDPTPSPVDVETTRRLAEAGRMLGIEVLDHVVIGDDGYISFREGGIRFQC